MLSSCLHRHDSPIRSCNFCRRRRVTSITASASLSSLSSSLWQWRHSFPVFVVIGVSSPLLLLKHFLRGRRHRRLFVVVVARCVVTCVCVRPRPAVLPCCCCWPPLLADAGCFCAGCCSAPPPNSIRAHGPALPFSPNPFFNITPHARPILPSFSKPLGLQVLGLVRTTMTCFGGS